MSKLKHTLQMLYLMAHKALKFQHQDQLRTINVFAYNCNCALLTINHPGTMRGNESGHYSSLWVSMLMANTGLAEIGVMCIGTGVLILVWAISLAEACPILKNVQNMLFSWCYYFSQPSSSGSSLPHIFKVWMYSFTVDIFNLMHKQNIVFSVLCHLANLIKFCDISPPYICPLWKLHCLTIEIDHS